MEKNCISVVIPVYNCSECLDEITERIISVCKRLDVFTEIILVDDASPDNAWDKIRSLAAKDNRIKGIKLSRNFGQHQAISAGLNLAIGQWIVVMDCDLQDDPDEIEYLFNKAEEGYDIVFAQRKERKDGALKISSSFLFHKLLSFFTNQRSDSSVANFGIYSRKVIDAYNRLTEQNRSFPILIRWFGYSIAYVPVKHSKRTEGKSSYTYIKLVKFAAEIIITHSNKPLYLSIFIGIISSLRFSPFFFVCSVSNNQIFDHRYPGAGLDKHYGVFIFNWRHPTS
jgi:glycosyltransferase involved in cell wall biosynthesis